MSIIHESSPLENNSNPFPPAGAPHSSSDDNSPYLVVAGNTIQIDSATDFNQLNAVIGSPQSVDTVTVWLGALWSQPYPMQTFLCRICRLIGNRARYLIDNRSLLASAIEALSRIAVLRRRSENSTLHSLLIQIAAATIENVDDAEAQLRLLFSTMGTRLPRNIKQLVKRAAVRLASAANTGQRICDLLTNQTIDPDLFIPRGWTFDAGQNALIRDEGPVRGESVVQIEGLLYVARKWIDRDTEQQWLELCWWNQGALRRLKAPREQLSRARLAETLSALGFPISCLSCKLFVSCIVDFLKENEFRLPTQSCVSRLGWLTLDGSPAFVLGSSIIRPAAQQSVAEQVTLDTADAAITQIGAAYRSHGDPAAARQLLLKVSAYPVIWFSILTSLASVLLEPLRMRGFILDICGETSHSKTITLIICASMFGDANDHNPHTQSSTYHGWDCTQVFAERLAAILRSLPVLLDDTRLVREPKHIAAITYALANGKGRGRGNKTSIDPQTSWALNAISTGEQSLTSFLEQGGMRARVITFRGSPVPGNNDEWRQRVERWRDLARQHYGHIGQEFLQHVVDHFSEMSEWRNRIDALKAQLSQQFGMNAVAGRHLDHLALIALTAELCCAWFVLPEQLRNPIAGVAHLLQAEYAEADRPTEAMEKLLDYVSLNHHMLVPSYAGMPHSGSQAGRPQPSTYIGKWTAIGTDSATGVVSLALFRQQFELIVTELGYSPDELLTAWKQRGWLHLGDDGRPLKNIRNTLPMADNSQRSGTVRSVCIRAEVISWFQQRRRSDEACAVPAPWLSGNRMGTP